MRQDVEPGKNPSSLSGEDIEEKRTYTERMRFSRFFFDPLRGGREERGLTHGPMVQSVVNTLPFTLCNRRPGKIGWRRWRAKMSKTDGF